MLRRRDVIGWTVLALMLVWPLALWGTDREVQESKAPIASLEVQATRVDWQPKVDYERLDLTIAGPGNFYVRQEFKAGQAPQLSLVNSKGDRLPDGSYAYELRLVPRQGKTFSEERLVQWGYLLIQDGSFADLASVQHQPANPNESSSKPKPILGNFVTKDVVQNDDFVVKGHECIGPACTTVEPGDPSLTLKEDVGGLQQIKFDNIGCCYPSTVDWAIQANDNGGPNGPNGDFVIRDLLYASIPFRILAGPTPDNSLTIFPNGNIGLGTLIASAPLHLQNRSGNTNTNVAVVMSSDNQNLFRIFETTNTGGLVSIFNNAGSETVRLSAEGSSWLASAGNVGIGTTSPGAKLEVSGGEVRFPPGAGAAAGLTHFKWEGDGRNYIRGTTLIADTGGNVGIGTASPAVRLDVKADVAGQVAARLQNSSATGHSGIHYLDSDGNIDLYFGIDNAASTTRLDSVNNNPILILTNSAERVRVTSGGNVGIGTAAPASLLHVNGGDIRVSGGSFIDDGVTLNAPDYVFEPSYKLMPLEELREFVTQEKHLPNIPNAREVKESGLNLSQFQMRLLEKVEELTLYTLSQDQRLSSQQDELLRLREQNALLQQRLAALEKALPAEAPE